MYDVVNVSSQLKINVIVIVQWHFPVSGIQILHQTIWVIPQTTLQSAGGIF